MSTTSLNQLAVSQKITATSVHGPRLTGIWRTLGIGVWLLLFLLCLSAFAMSVFYIDLWFSTPYAEISQLDPEIELEVIEEVIRPFQDAISDLGLTLDIYSHYFTILRILAGLPYFIISILIIHYRNDRLMAVFFAMGLALLGAAGTLFNPLWEWIPESYPWYPIINNLLSTLLFCCVIILYTFPDGRFVPGLTRWLAVLVIPYTALSFFIPDAPINPGNWLGPLSFVPPLIFLGGGVFAMVYRYRRYADAVQKQKIKWFAVGAALFSLNWLIDFAVWEIYPILTEDYLIQAGRSAVIWELLQDTFWYVTQFVFVACIAISVFRYRLWDIDLVINRVLVYGSLTVLTMLLYMVTVGALGSLFWGLAEQWAFFLATGLVAILFEPLRRRLQRAVNRLMYGDRDDPYAVLTRLSGALETTPNPDDVLPVLSSQVGEALKIPYVAIYLTQNGDEQLAAYHGNPHGGELCSFHLVYQDETIGRLSLSPRAPGEGFSRADRQLIENIAQQAGAAAQSVRLHRQLLRSRAQIVTEREEERRRIRSDLHDELGPILASQSLKLAAAGQMIPTDPAKAGEIVEEVAQQSRETVTEIRRLVHGLRPPALDQLGLVDAVRDFTRDSHEFNSQGVTFEISAPSEGLPDLPAAVEVNAYRIALEALTNTTRHAQAKHCLVKFLIEKENIPEPSAEALVLQISDDGDGLPNDFQAGVGLRSMRERAEEIGGKFTIESSSSRGTQITAWLPLSI